MWSRHCGVTIPTLTYTQVTAFARVPVRCVLAEHGDRPKRHSEGQQSQRGIPGRAEKVEANPNESRARRPADFEAGGG